MSNEEITIEAFVGRYNEWTVRWGENKVSVTEPLKVRTYYRNEEWDPSRMDAKVSEVEARFSYGNLSAEGAAQGAELLALAAEMCEARNRQAGPELADQIRRRAEYLDREKKLQEEKDRARNELKDLLQNYIGTQFKLKRDGYRATVFGTVDRFDERYVYTTSERGVRMSTRIADVNFFAVKWDGEKRYETVYDRAAQAGVTA